MKSGRRKDILASLPWLVAMVFFAGCSHSFSLDYHRYHLRDGTYLDLEKEYQDRSHIYGYSRIDHGAIRIVRKEIRRAERFSMDFGPCPDCEAEAVADSLAADIALSFLEEMEGTVEEAGLLAAIVIPMALFQGLSEVEHINREKQHYFHLHIPDEGFDWEQVEQIPSDEEIEEWEAWVEAGNQGMIPDEEEPPEDEIPPE